MTRDELHKFFSTLGDGAKGIGGIHDNFGVGAKIASLPWNPDGVVVISYREGKGAMIWIVLNEDSGDYELVEFNDGGETKCVVNPEDVIDEDGIQWGMVAPDWAKEHGTVVVLLGSEEFPDTVLGNPHGGEEKGTKGLSVYLNSRFWDLSQVDVKVVELRSEKKSQWPQSPGDRDDARRPNNRKINGARFYLTELEGKNGSLDSSGTIHLAEGRVAAEWYLWHGERPQVHAYAREGGYIAVRYRGELFELTTHKAHIRWFGIIESKVQQNLTIILEPQLYQQSNGRWGVHPDQSRNKLHFTGNGEKGGAVPLPDWGYEFAENLPEQIQVAIKEARGDVSGAIEDEEYRKRLQDKFGTRWRVKTLVKANGGETNSVAGTITDEDVEVIPSGTGKGRNSRRRRKKTVKLLRKRAVAGGNDLAVLMDTPVDVPRFRMAPASNFEKKWHLAVWAPRDPSGPTVLINQESPILDEIIGYHQAMYPEVYAEQVEKTIQQVFGEIAACKVAHSQKLAKMVAEEELDADYRSEAALTVALMGLMAEEAVISQRLGKLGRKKSAANSSQQEELVPASP